MRDDFLFFTKKFKHESLKLGTNCAMSKILKAVIGLIFLASLIILPQINGGLCVASVDESVAIQIVSKRYAESISQNYKPAPEVICTLSAAEGSKRLAEVSAKWQSECNAPGKVAVAGIVPPAKFYYITRCGFASYAYSL